MKHRHLTEDAGFSLAAVDDIIDRGLPIHWVGLGSEILRDPSGTVSERVLYVCSNHAMFGSSALWVEFVHLARRAP
ncbi:MAG: hypothetical protein ABI346_02905 [Candidatus Baltobacteraceae bacterium]